MTKKLNEESLQSWLEKRPGWSLKEGALVKDFRFKSFRNAIVFVNRVASLADETKRLPEIHIKGGLVRLFLFTPAAKGVTQQDLELAQAVDFATSAR